MSISLRGVRPSGSTRSWLAALLVAAAAAASPLPAQTGERPPAYMSRAELESAAARAESGATGDAQRLEAASLRERLREGDFRVGDRVVVVTQSTLGLPPELMRALNDTLVVREGRVLRLPNMPDLPLQGLLRSELGERLGAHVRAYLRDVTVRVEPMVQGLISGPVARPGYITLAPDMLVTDALMAGGGAAQNADLTRTIVKRNGKEIIGRDSLQAAVRAGATLDRIGFQSGDELAVGEKKQRNWGQILQFASIGLSLALLLASLANR